MSQQAGKFTEHFKEAYSFDDRGVFIGTCRAWASPLEPGKFMLPAMATFDAPRSKRGQTPIWNGTEWEYAPARRKRFWRSDGTHVDVIDHPQFHPGEGHSETEPEHIALQKQIADIRDDIADEMQLVDALRTRAIQAMMDQIATPEERDALKVVQKAMKKIEKLTEKMKP